MSSKRLNIVYIGQNTFPNGTATTKRRRYMVDYMNEHGISSKVLVTFYRRTLYDNKSRGFYKSTPYVDINDYILHGKLFKYIAIGKAWLKKWYRYDCKNILIFPTVLTVWDFPFYCFAKKMGYKIIFDQVETSYLKSGGLKLVTKLYYFLNEFCTKIAYPKSSSFVISKSLFRQNRERYPKMKLALLPNSTPILSSGKKELGSPLLVLYSGTYGEKEGVEYLIKGVLKSISLGCYCRLVLLGKAPQNLMSKYSGIPEVHFSGFVHEDDLKRYLAESDILAMVRTNTEFANFGFPFKLSEYLSTGNVVIATKVGDIPEYLTDKKDAYLIEPESVDAVCDIIMYIRNNPEEALKVAEQGLNTMKKKFSIDSVGRRFIAFLQNV